MLKISASVTYRIFFSDLESTKRNKNIIFLILTMFWYPGPTWWERHHSMTLSLPPEPLSLSLFPHIFHNLAKKPWLACTYGVVYSDLKFMWDSPLYAVYWLIKKLFWPVIGQKKRARREKLTWILGEGRQSQRKAMWPLQRQMPELHLIS